MGLEFQQTPISGCFTIDLTPFTDARGNFIKLFQQTRFGREKIPFEMKESFYSVSKKGVIRGLHFQIPPKSCDKMIVCLSGRIFDVVVDLRKGLGVGGGPRVFTTELRAPSAIFVPRGCAHGFQALADETGLLYLTNEEYDPGCDQGILWSSVEGLRWPLPDPVLSARDQAFPAFSRYESPF